MPSEKAFLLRCCSTLLRLDFWEQVCYIAALQCRTRGGPALQLSSFDWWGYGLQDMTGNRHELMIGFGTWHLKC